jgi:hypothetical protein
MAMALHYYYGKYVFTYGKGGLYRKIIFNYLTQKLKKKAKKLQYHFLEKGTKGFYLSDKVLIDIILPESFPTDIIIFKHFSNLHKNYSIYNDHNATILTVGELSGNIKIMQAIPGIKSVSQVDLLMGNYSTRKNDKDIIVQVVDSKGKVLAVTKCNSSEIKNNQWHIFKFDKPVILNPKAKYNYIVITSPGSKPGNAVTIYMTKDIWGFKKNGKWQNGTSLMKLYSR